MKIAIHPNTNQGFFSGRWIDYCKANSINYKIVNCYDSNIISQLRDCDALLWHHSHSYYKDILFAKQLLNSLEKIGKKVFPNFDTGWHFDDKVGQKYLLEAIGAPLVPSYVFYSKKEAFEWINSTTFPKVFKLRGGAGSSNVQLVRTKRDALNIVNKAFGSGFSVFNRMGNFKERIYRYRSGKESVIGLLKGVGRFLIPMEDALMQGKDKGYVYFQDFIPNNNFDIRVIVIGDRAFAIKRMTRKNDFRASGSGAILYDKIEINEDCIKIAFDINKKLSTQCIGFDFVFSNNQPLIVEIGYGFYAPGYDPCPGYWTSDLNWHQGNFNPQSWIIENLISTIVK